MGAPWTSTTALEALCSPPLEGMVKKYCLAGVPFCIIEPHKDVNVADALSNIAKNQTTHADDNQPDSEVFVTL